MTDHRFRYLVPTTFGEAPHLAIQVDAPKLHHLLRVAEQVAANTVSEFTVDGVYAIDAGEVVLPDDCCPDPGGSKDYGVDGLHVLRGRPEPLEYTPFDGGVINPVVRVSDTGISVRARQYKTGPGEVESIEIPLSALRLIATELESA